jgi:pimeloyl-ACP methyl ester carboxylesterase
VFCRGWRNWNATGAPAPGPAAGRLGEISVPVLVAGGTRDRVVPPQLLRVTAAGLPDARLLLLRGRGHATALFGPRLRPAIAAFLAEPGR